MTQSIMADTMDIKDQIVGDQSLAWSKDNCIAIATNKNVILYDLNPLKELRCPRMLYKIQALSSMKSLDYDVGAKEFLEDYDKLRAITARDAAYPDFQIYKMHLDLSLNRQHDNEETGNSGFRSVSFSPLNCAVAGGTILAILTMGKRLLLYTRDSDGTSISWCKAVDLSEILTDILKNNDGYYPDIKLPSYKMNAAKITEKQHAACITCASWCDSFCVDKGFILLATSTKNNFILIWKLELPICAASKAYVVDYVKTDIQGIKCLSWSKSDLKQESHHRLAAGGIEGDIECFAINVDGNLKMQNMVWSDKDQLTAMDIAWNDLTADEENEYGFLAAKGCMVVYFQLTSEFKRLSYTVLNGIHAMPIHSIQNIEDAVWMAANDDGTLVKVWLESKEESNQGKLKLEHDVLMRRNEPSSIFHESTHTFVFSPNKVFMATLRSKPKVSRSIQVEKSGYVNITLLPSGIEALQSVIFNVEQNHSSSSKMDLLESIRLHLLHKEFFSNESDYLIFQSYMKQFLSTSREVNSLKWFLLKMAAVLLSSNDTSYETTLLEFEKKLAGRQMVKILRSWEYKTKNDQEAAPPFKSIMEWLQKNQTLLNDEDQNFIKTFKVDKKFLKDELCSITGAKLLMSDDARTAITEDGSMSWRRCCLTFRTLQGYKCRKCEISNSRAKIVTENDNNIEKELLQDVSIYSGLPML